MSESTWDGAGKSSSSSGPDWLCESLSCSMGREEALNESGREEESGEGRKGEGMDESNVERGGEGSIDSRLDEIDEE